MLSNLNLTKGLIFSQGVMLELTKKGFSREYSYKVVQKHSANAWNKNISLLDSLKRDKKIYEYFDSKKLNKIFDLNYYTRKIDLIFNRVFN
jgi:adenylosuccinate lyase